MVLSLWYTEALLYMARGLTLFRVDGRSNQDPRTVKITPRFLAFPEGSALIEVGQTKVICTASVEDRVPGWRRGQGRGWVTAEYSMLPRATLTRRDRETGPSGLGGRTQEIRPETQPYEYARAPPEQMATELWMRSVSVTNYKMH